MEDTATLTDDLTARIRTARFRANLTQEELARRLGVSTRSVQSWEQGTIPGPRMRRKLARFLSKYEAAA